MGASASEEGRRVPPNGPGRPQSRRHFYALKIVVCSTVLHAGRPAYERAAVSTHWSPLRSVGTAPMLFPSATVVAALVLSPTGTGPLASPGARRHEPARAAVTKVAASLWAPKKSSPKKSTKDV